MQTPQSQLKTIPADALVPPVLGLVDEMLACYSEWRRDADAVADAYAGWSVAAAGEKTLRFAAYAAALDQEQNAADGYARSISELERWLPPSKLMGGSQ